MTSTVNGQEVQAIRRIGDAVCTPRFFNETLPFSISVPYRLTKRSVFGNDDAPLHYASSLEIVLYENVMGDVVTNGRHLKIAGNTVIVNPPMFVHGGWVTGENGIIYCLQISLESMAHYIRIDSFLNEQHIRLQDAPMCIPEYDWMKEQYNTLFSEDGNVFKRNIAILRILEALARHIPCSRHASERLGNENENLKTMISWTHTHCAEHITLEDAASVVGFSKHYFCRWFKQHTNMNYIQYVKRVRIYNASKLLLSEKPVSEVAYDCGFENVSYFIKCFKEIRGCTPKQYIESARRTNVL